MNIPKVVEFTEDDLHTLLCETMERCIDQITAHYPKTYLEIARELTKRYFHPNAAGCTTRR